MIGPLPVPLRRAILSIAPVSLLILSALLTLPIAAEAIGDAAEKPSIDYAVPYLFLRSGIQRMPASGGSPVAGLAIIQFRAPPSQATLEALRGQGATILGYVPENGVILYSEKTLQPVTPDPIYWSGELKPHWKISPHLGSHNNPTVNVVLFPPLTREDAADEIASRIDSLGGAVISRGPFALRARIAPDQLLEIARDPRVSWIEPEDGEFRETMAIIRDFTGADSANRRGYDGAGIRVAVCDGGTDFDHPEFGLNPRPDGTNDQIVRYLDYRDGDPSTVLNAHGTATASIIAALGRNPNVEGEAAPGVKLIVQECALDRLVSPDELTTWINDAAANGAVVMSNSWGGDETGEYNLFSQTVDGLVRIHGISVLLGAGNNYRGRDESQLYPSISSIAANKNGIAVGAYLHHDDTDPSNDEWGAWYGLGPPNYGTTDGRLKPDFVAPFDYVYVADIAGPAGYNPDGDYFSGFGGTSAATPITAGGLAILYEAYIANHFGNNPAGSTPSPSMMKALVAATSRQMIDPATNAWLPNANRTKTGWGEIDLISALEAAGGGPLVDESDVDGFSSNTDPDYRWTVQSDGRGPLRVVLSWTDPEGWLGAARALVNDLDLLLTSPSGVEYKGNYGLLPHEDNPDGSPWSLPGGSFDRVNNMEAVFVHVPEAGTWTIRVKPYNIFSPTQRFSLVATQGDRRGPMAPAVSSPTHPDQNTWYSDHNPTLDWTIPYDYSSVFGYSYTLDKSSWTIPDTKSEGTRTSWTYVDLPDGEWFFHVRAKDGWGNWGDTAHYRIRISSGTAQNDADSGRDAGRDRSGAVAIGPGTYTGMLDESSDDSSDVYVFSADSGQFIDVTMTPPSDANLELELSSPNDVTKAESKNPTGYPEHVSYVADQSGSWAIRIYTPNIDDGAYVFTLSVGGSPPSRVALDPPGSIGTSSMTLNWSRSADADFSRYEVHLSTTDGFVPTHLTRYATVGDVSKTTYTVSGLSSGVRYYFVVRVVDQEGLFADSNMVSAVTLEDRPTVVLWERGNLADPYSAQRLANGNTLIAEASNARVIEVRPDGTIEWQYGVQSCGTGFNQVCSPHDAKRLSNGNTIIADTANERVIEVDANKNIVWQYGTNGVPGSGSNQLYRPWDVEVLPNGNILIADSGNYRVIEVDRSRNIIWSYANEPDPVCYGMGYCFQPLDVEWLPNGNVLILEEQGQVREVTRSKAVVWSYGIAGDPSGGLNHPRSATRLSNGDTLISDSNSRRVIQVNSAKSVVWTYSSSLLFPVDAIRLEDGNTLIADTALGKVLQVGPAPYPTASVLNPVSSITNESMTLTWNANTDSSFARYEIYQSQTDGFIPSPLERVATIPDPTVTTWVASGLEDLCTYYFRVRTVNIWDLHADSNQVSGTTAPDPPDLVPLELTFEPANPAVNNTPVTANALLANTGGLSASNFVVRFYLGDPHREGVQIGTDILVPSLAGRASMTVSTTWTPTATGIYNVYVLADATSQVAEIFETNNWLYSALIVHSEPDLIPTRLTTMPASRANEGDLVTVSATILNSGETAASGVVATVFWGDPGMAGVPVASSDPIDVPAGSQVEFSIPWIANQTGTAGLFLLVDASGLVSEFDECNNLAHIPYSVNALPSIPVLKQPLDGERIGTRTPTLGWMVTDPEGTALQYILELSSDAFQSVLLRYDQRTNSSQWSASSYPSGAIATFTIPSANALMVGQTIWWRVRAWDGEAMGPVSQVWTFTLESQAPEIAITFPAPDSYINVPQPVISVDISDDIAGVDPTSILLQVDARIFRLGDAGLSWNGSTLELDTGDADMLFLDGESPQVAVSVADTLGNAASSSWAFRVDLSPPTTTVSLSGILGDDGWYVTAVTASLAASDSGSGVDSILYRANGGAWQQYGEPISLGDGEHVLEFFAVDVVGNVEDLNLVFVKADAVVPSAYASLAGTGGENGWYISAVTVTLSASDQASGVAGLECRVDGSAWKPYDEAIVISQDGVHTFMFRAVDVAGNEAIATITFAIDTTAPMLSGASPLQGAIVTTSSIEARWSGSDATSGIDHYEIQLDGGPWVSTGYATAYTLEGLADGEHVITIRAIDRAGNTQMMTVTFTVNTKPFSAQGPGGGAALYSLIAATLTAVLMGAFFWRRRRRRRLPEPPPPPPPPLPPPPPG